MSRLNARVTKADKVWAGEEDIPRVAPVMRTFWPAREKSWGAATAGVGSIAEVIPTIPTVERPLGRAGECLNVVGGGGDGVRIGKVSRKSYPRPAISPDRRVGTVRRVKSGKAGEVECVYGLFGRD